MEAPVAMVGGQPSALVALSRSPASAGRSFFTVPLQRLFFFFFAYIYIIV